MTGAGDAGEGGWPRVESREQSWDGEGIEESRNRELGGEQGEGREGGKGGEVNVRDIQRGTGSQGGRASRAAGTQGARVDRAQGDRAQGKILMPG